MRPIKFRAWSEKYKMMSDSFSFNDLLIKEYGGKKWAWVKFEENMEEYIGDCELMQFTGLKDSKGVEIYEGDILRNKGVVEYDECAFGWSEGEGHWQDLNSGYFHEVIGNIYENPEKQVQGK